MQNLESVHSLIEKIHVNVSKSEYVHYLVVFVAKFLFFFHYLSALNHDVCRLYTHGDDFLCRATATTTQYDSC